MRHSTARRILSSQHGFSLVEAATATLVGLQLVLGIGLLSQSLTHKRVSADARSAAVSLAERKMEQILALPNPSTNASLSAGTQGPCASPPCLVGVDGSSTLNGPYLLQWTVVDNGVTGTPLVDSTASSKKITVSLTHVTDANARATLQTYYKYK
jgi:Tfp pilus assembly protein PilV